MNMSSTRREGFALAVAIFAIVVIGAIVAGAFFASNQDYRLGRNTLLQERALSISEYGLNKAISDWNVTTNTTMAVGATSPTAFYTAAAQAGGANTNDQAIVRVTRLNDLTFWVVSEGWVGSSLQAGARRRTGAILRLYIPQFNILGALTLRGALKIGGSSMVDGDDAKPANWSCGAAQPKKPGVATNDSSGITYSGCSNARCIDGAPQIANVPRAGDDSTYFDFGGVKWADLVKGAKVVTINPSPAPTLFVGTNVCNAGDMNNWGDVNRNLVTPGGCEGYFPVIYIPGNASIQGGKGQGILLVEGDLKVTGKFEFYGPVIVRGTLHTMGTGGHFNGGVMAANVHLEQNDVLGNAVINYSSCAVAAASLGSTLPTPALRRGWADMF